MGLLHKSPLRRRRPDKRIYGDPWGDPALVVEGRLMFSIIEILGMVFKGPLARIMDTVDKNIAAGVDREKLKTDLAQSYLTAQTRVLSGHGWWFPLFFLAPAGFWFASVCVYSVLWCHACAFPQTWTVAALPAPLDQWEGWIVSSMFVGGAGSMILGRLGK